MPRTGKITPREMKMDPIFGNKLVSKLINNIMRQGKKNLAEQQVYQSLEIIKEKLNKNPLEILEAAIRNITPQMEVRSRRVGGAAYQVPVPIKSRRSQALALRWLVQEARRRPNSQYHRFRDKLAAEILDAAQGEGMAFQRKITSHKMAEANKAFAHFRW